MKIFYLPKGLIEIELYRTSYVLREKLRKISRRFNRFRPVVRALAATTLFATVPMVGTQPMPDGFPVTDNPLVFTAGITPIASAESAVEIKPGLSLAQEAELATRRKKRTFRREVIRATYPPCPSSWRPFYQEVGPRFGVPWQVLEAIHQVESGKSCHTNRTSSAGAVGPMQFLPSTWRKYQWDCSGDGLADITNAYDAICTAAHHIGTGLTGYSLERSIFSYNRSWGYVNKVMTIAREIGLEG